MIKLILLVILFLTAGYLFSPYITSLVNYVSFGLSKLSEIISNIGSIFSYFLNIFTQYQYIMLLLAIFICIRVIFYIIDILRGAE